MDPHRQEIKDKINKLMAMANDDGCFDGEVSNALRLAKKLMEQHHFTEADLANPEAAVKRAQQVGYGRVWAECGGLKISDWETSLATAISNLVVTCKRYCERQKAPQKNADGSLMHDVKGNLVYRQHIVFYGPLNDIGDAKHLFHEWQYVITEMAKRKTGTAFRGPGRSYAQGFADALIDKVKKVQEESKTLIGTTALVCVEANKIMEMQRREAGNWLQREAGIRLVRGPAKHISLEHNAYGAGRADGSKANFTRAVKPRLGGA